MATSWATTPKDGTAVFASLEVKKESASANLYHLLAKFIVENNKIKMVGPMYRTLIETPKFAP